MIAWEPEVRLGPYVLLSPVGRGGMGEVWKARDTRLDRVVAIKRLHEPHSTRFEQEARAIAALNHPHICQIYDVGSDYLVLEYIAGHPLTGPLAPEEAVRLGIQIADALAAAHRRGIVHRDLKPANIMLTEDRAVKLLDFGLAKPFANFDSDVTHTLEGTVKGTVAYMAPEQAEGKASDERSDIFSFGAVLYELISGRRAFAGENAISTIAAILHKEPATLDAPEDLGKVVHRCLRKAPEDRFQSMAEVKAALQQSSAKSDRQPSIAVLPFANMSGDKDNEYFSDGLSEEIITSLTHVPGLKVTARTSAFAFRGKDQDIRKIAETLNVRTILEGSVRRAGNRVRVTAQLVNAADGYHLWSERFDREISDVFAVQDEIAAAIANALQLKLGPASATSRHKTNLPAYEAYLRGRYHSFKATPEGYAQAKESFEQAITLDPELAAAHVALAGYYVSLAFYALRPAHEAMPQAREAAQRALSLDASLQEAQATLGVIAAAYDYDWKEAERWFRHAMSTEPIASDVRGMYAGWYLVPQGRFQEAVEQLERAVDADPLNIPFRVNLSFSRFSLGQIDRAFAELRAASAIDENYWTVHATFSLMYASLNKVEEALPYAERNHRLAPWSYRSVGILAGTLMRTGDQERAERLIQPMLEDPERYGIPFGLMMYNVQRGDPDAAAEWLAKAIEQRDTSVLPRFVGPMAKSLRSSSRWNDLLQMMNLPAT